MRQEELKRNPTGNMNDAFNKANSGGLVDLVGSLGWKGTGILILVITGIYSCIVLQVKGALLEQRCALSLIEVNGRIVK